MNISNQLNTVPYLGSKYSILPWLLPLLPETKSFVEVFGGSMVVTMNRKPSPIETYNDINGEVVNFFRMLREKPEELITALYLTPHSRKEYESAWMDPADTPLEQARKFFVRLRQSFLATGSQNRQKGWESSIRESRCKISEAVNKNLNSVENLWKVVRRIKEVQIECRPWQKIMEFYDTPETLLYLDPPYDREKRSGGSDYKHDFTEKDHIELHDIAIKCKSRVAVSGYDSDFMKELWSDYFYIPGPARKNNRSNRQVRESLWTSYDPTKIHSGRLF